MSNEVYANGREVSCKAAAGKSICAFPDVCMTPPQTPATPPGVPIPYPNTGMASDCSDGSKNVKISGEEVLLKDKSYFKKSMGDEAGCAPMKGVISHKIQGKIYFTSWSPDVKFEGENVVRTMDLTTHNHGSNPNEAVPWPYTDAVTTLGKFDKCRGDKEKIKTKCKEDGKEGAADQCPGLLSASVTEQRDLYDREAGASKTEQAGTQATDDAEGSECVKAMRCFLRPYSKDLKGQSGCCPGQSPHHIPPKSMLNGFKGYSEGSALCVCMEGASQHVGSHGENHAALDYLAEKNKWGKCTVKEYNEICAIAVAAQCGCSKECIEQQLNKSLGEHLDKKVTHWQSNSKQLGDTKKLDAAFDAAKKVADKI
jgi:hypothetical protein